MSVRQRFLLPDLGEGLPDATVVEWMVKPGEVIRLDEPLVAMETAKAVVEVPAPCSGKLLKIGGAAGSVIVTGSLLAEFELDPSLPQRAAGHDTGHHHGGGHADPADDHAAADSGATDPEAAAVQTTSAAKDEADTQKPEPADAGTVVGAMSASNQLRSESAVAVGGVKAMPAVRALARKLGVDILRVTPTGADGVVTAADVKLAAEQGVAASPLPASAGRGAGGEGSTSPEGTRRSAGTQAAHPHAASTAEPSSQTPAPAAPSPQPLSHRERGLDAARTALSASGHPLRTRPPGQESAGQPQPLAGMRRTMARVMAQARAEVVLTTITDDADLVAWPAGTDVTVRLVRAMVRACRVEPALNAWLDGKQLTRTLHPQVDLGIAVDTPEGLFVPVLRNADLLDATQTREAINRLRAQVEARTIPTGELTGATISLSNFGRFAGRYATPIVVPPAVAILGAGRLRHEVVAVVGGIETHRVMPLSLSFDHRAVTGGEAARWLRHVLDDLALSN